MTSPNESLAPLTVRELVSRLQHLDPDAHVLLRASFDGMCGTGWLAHVAIEPEGVALYDQEMTDLAPDAPDQLASRSANGYGRNGSGPSV